MKLYLVYELDEPDNGWGGRESELQGVFASTELAQELINREVEKKIAARREDVERWIKTHDTLYGSGERDSPYKRPVHETQEELELRYQELYITEEEELNVPIYG